MRTTTRGLACLAGVGLRACGTGDGGASARDDRFPGLTAEVEILWDDLGIPHAYGATDAAAYYGAAYAMATARLFQMDQLRRRALGRWAEVMGEERLADDELSRLLGFRRLAERDADLLAESHPDAWALVVAWCAGINARIAEVRSGEAPVPYRFAELDYEPEPWDPVDLVAVSHAAFFSTSDTLEAELLISVVRNLTPDVFDSIELIEPFYPVYALPEVDRPSTTAAPVGRSLPRPAVDTTPEEIAAAAQALVRLHRALAPFRGAGSNNFSVHGSHTADGRPLLANDPHLAFESPNVMFGLHINSTGGSGTFDVAGLTLAGSLGVSLGHNRRVAWSATTGFADVMDAWEVRMRPDGVVVAGEVVPVTTIEEPIVVRGDGMPAGEGRTVDYRVRLVEGYGVLLPSDITPVSVARPGRTLLLGYVGFEPFSGSDGLLSLQRAGSVAEVEDAVDRVPGLGFNFVFADASDIAYRVGQTVPDRGMPSDARAPWITLDGHPPRRKRGRSGRPALRRHPRGMGERGIRSAAVPARRRGGPDGAPRGADSAVRRVRAPAMIPPPWAGRSAHARRPVGRTESSGRRCGRRRSVPGGHGWWCSRPSRCSRWGPRPRCTGVWPSRDGPAPSCSPGCSRG